VPAEVANGGVSCGARLLWHLIMMRVASDSGLKARGRKRQGEENKTSLPLLHVQGKKYKKQCRLKTALFNLSFFFQRMKRRRFSQNVPFHLNENWSKVPDFTLVL
jgi:hypothetical protein